MANSNENRGRQLLNKLLGGAREIAGAAVVAGALVVASATVAGAVEGQSSEQPEAASASLQERVDQALAAYQASDAILKPADPPPTFEDTTFKKRFHKKL
jgi:hypothetical protein